MENYYAVLEVSENASFEEIKEAYRALVKMCHPDHNNGNKFAQEKFKRIQAAYEVLSDSQKRRDYDAELHQTYEDFDETKADDEVVRNSYLLFNKKKIELVAKTTIGRDYDNSVVIDDKLVSRHHALIRKIKEDYFLKDENSTNGTLLNYKKIPRGEYVKLAEGDKITVGRSNLVFESWRQQTWNHAARQNYEDFYETKKEATHKQHKQKNEVVQIANNIGVAILEMIKNIGAFIFKRIKNIGVFIYDWVAVTLEYTGILATSIISVVVMFVVSAVVLCVVLYFAVYILRILVSCVR